MNTENPDMGQLREAWLKMGKALGMSAAPDNNPEDLDRKKTALDRLRDKYRRFWCVALIMSFTSFMIFSRNPSIDGNLGFWLGIAFAIYFLTVFCMDHWLWNGIRSIDPLRMGVAEVVKKSMFYRKRHLQFVAILIPMGIAILGFTAYVFSAEPPFLYGMVIGGVIGAIIGTIQFRRFMAEYRKLSE